MKGAALRGHLDGLLLATMRAGPCHGYAIVEELRRLSAGFFDLPEGTIYPALRRLEQEGLLSSRWDMESSRRRRVYVLTASGRASLSRRRRTWDEFAIAVTAVLDGWPAATPV